MTTHRRAWSQRAGVVVALITGALLAAPATPALADAPTITNVSASPNSIEHGETVKVGYTLKFNTTLPNPDPPADITVSSSNSKLTCVSGCSASAVTDDGDRSATFRYATAATSNESATITIKATPQGGGEASTQSTTVTLVGKPAQPKTVKQVCGKVVNKTSGAAVSNATVILQDQQSHNYTTTSNGSGNFCFNGTDDRPIVPGTLQLGAGKNDVTVTKSLSAGAGQSVGGQQLALDIPAPTPTASPSTEETPTDLPSDDGITDEPTEEVTQGPATVTQKETSSGGGMGQWLLIIAGGLLVALGVGAIVLLWMRRKEGDDDGPDRGGPNGGGPPPSYGPAQGGYAGANDATRVATRMGGDPTMAGGAALANAPTMMHNRPLVDDEFPDPYGAPLPSQQPNYGRQADDWANSGGAGYGGTTNAPTQAGYGGAGAAGYGAAQNQSYGNAPGSGAGSYGNAPGSGAGSYGNAPGSGAGSYGNAPGSGAGSYGNAPGQQGYGGGYTEGYGEQTGRYDGGGDGGYGQQPADPYNTSYGQGGGADERYGQGQGQGAYPSGGYGADAGYGESGGGAGYDNRGGYDSSGQYGAQGYDQQGYGYDQQGGQGYDQQGGQGYDQQGGQGYGQYGGQGYDQQGGGQGGYDNRGYGADQGGYDAGGHQQQGGYGYDQQQGGHQRDDRDAGGRGGRRSVDWLDD